MDIEKLIENAKVCCGDIEAEDCGERCINPRDKRGNELRWCSQWLIHDLHLALSTLQAELEQVKRDRDAAAADIKALLQKADYVGVCWACKYGNTDCRSDNCREAEWRGPKEE